MKAVFFDFDGTLTFKSPNIWKSIWAKLGYDIGDGSEYKRQLNAFLNGEISYSRKTTKYIKQFYKKKIEDFS